MLPRYAIVADVCYLDTPSQYQRMGGASRLGPYPSRSICESVNSEYFNGEGTCSCTRQPPPPPDGEDAKKQVKTEQTEFDRMNDVWLRKQRERIRVAVRKNKTYTREMIRAIKVNRIPSPARRPSSLEDLQPGDILLVEPENIIGQGFRIGDMLIRSLNELAEGKVFKLSLHPVSHAIAFVKHVKGTMLFLDHRGKEDIYIPSEGTRIKDQEDVKKKYGHRKAYIARPLVVIDGKEFWSAASEAARKKDLGFGLFGRGNVVCSELIRLAILKATKGGGEDFIFEAHRLGPVDITPGAFYDIDGKYFIIYPLERW